MFKFKGISSLDMQVIIEEEEHFIAKAAHKYEITEIEGRDGADFDDLGYLCVERPILVQCLNVNKIDSILAWLDGEGILEYEGRKTKARFYSQLEPQRTAGIRIIDTTFIRDPFWNKVVDDYIAITNTINNEGSYKSRPIIKIEKSTSETIELTLGGVRFKYIFPIGENYVEIDCEKKIAMYNNLNRDRQLEIGYKFPVLSIGINIVTIHNGDSTIKVKRKDRWL